MPARYPLPTQPFFEFKSGNIRGQCRVNDNRIDFLNVLSEPQWRGHFRRFLRELRTHYKMIRMWSVNGAAQPAIFRSILAHYGFSRGTDVDAFGEFQEVWDLNL